MDDYKQLIIARKDLNMSPGKLAAQVSHGSLAYFTSLIKENASLVDLTPKYCVHSDITPHDEYGIILYRNTSLYKLAKEAHDRGEEFFYARPADSNKPYGNYVTCNPQLYYHISFNLSNEIYEEWIQGSFTKIVCEARNRNHLLKAVDIAESYGLVQDKDYFLIKDNCWTELEPEEPDGKTLTVIGFKPLPNEIVSAISHKYQLYK